MEQLEAQMKKEHDTAAMKAYLQKGALRNADCRPGALVGTARADPTPLSSSQNEARRRLIRLWSSANHAIMKGC
eukprot:6546330-Pyramimonas_sp.AAC.1